MNAANRRLKAVTLALASCLAWALTLATAPAHGQNYPTRPINLVLGYPPGGSTDVVARVVAPKLGEILGTTVVVENKAGANGIIGSDFVAKAAPDGYTLLLISSSPLVIAPHTYAHIPYDTLRDFAAITTVGVTPEALAVNPEVPAKNMKELAELSRTRDIAISSSGNGGLPHLAIELLKEASKGRIVHVPYKGGGPAVTDAIGGHVQGVLIDLPAVLPFVKAGKLRALAITAKERTDFLPDVPTSVEQGFPTVIAVNWIGIAAPAKTPKPIVDKLYAALVQVATSPQVKAQFASAGVTASTMPSPEAFQQFLRDEYAKWGKIAKESGARMED